MITKTKFSVKFYSIAFITFLLIPTAHANPDVYSATLLKSFSTFDARQGVAVGSSHFYATHNYRITKHDKKTGKPILQWDGGNDETGPLIHLDSLVKWKGKLYAAHSNYPHLPMLSSVEVWDAKTMKHIQSHSFGRAQGSFTWLDRYEGAWWGGFGNYDKVQKGQNKPYGETKNTVIVKMNDHFQIIQSWSLPQEILQRIAPMSNSGGSFGSDGYLYLTGHDHEEVYVVKIPQIGSELLWIATVKTPGIEGQGIAWDRTTNQRILWGILKRERYVKSYLVPEIKKPSNEKERGVVNNSAHFSKN